MRQPLITIFITLALCFHCAQGQDKNSKPLSNADIIEMSRAGVPEGTILTAIQFSGTHFDVSPEGIVALHAGGVAERILNIMIKVGSRSRPAGSFGVATGTFPVAEALGKNVRFSAWIKTENVLNGYAGIWWRVDGPEKGKTLSFDNSQYRSIGDLTAAGSGVMRGATGTTGWTRYEFELPVPAGATNINFGLLFTGTGTAWFDSLGIDLNGVPYVNIAAFDPDFESTMARGFYTGGAGYRVGVDNTTAHTGRQSLKMQSIGDGSDPR